MCVCVCVGSTAAISELKGDGYGKYRFYFGGKLKCVYIMEPGQS